MNPRLLWLLALIMTVNVAGLAQTYNAASRTVTVKVKWNITTVADLVITK